MKTARALALLVVALSLLPLASAQEPRGPDEPSCRNVNFPLSEERLVRACHAQFNFCANPPPAWQRLPQVMQVCAAIERERLLPRAAITGAPREPAIVNPPTVAVGPSGHAAALAGAWKLNGNGFVGDASVQQNADGTLNGGLYGDALTGYYAPGERVGVWLRLQGGRPIQAFVGQASADGASFAGRIYTLNATTSGGNAQRNVFAFSAQRGASAPPNPDLPPAAAGPANVSGTHAIVGNGFAGTLQLNQAPDGTLNGSVYGQPIEGHYAAGSGTIAFIRYSAPGQPYQLFVGSVTAQGVQNGELFALNANAGASAQRMRFGWMLQAMAPAVAVAPTSPQSPPQNQLAPATSTFVSAGVTVPAPRIEGWTIDRPDGSYERSSHRIVTTQRCPAGKVVTGSADHAELSSAPRRPAPQLGSAPGRLVGATGGGASAGSSRPAHLRVIGRVPVSDGSGLQTIAAADTPVLPSQSGLHAFIVCIDRPEGYEIVLASGVVNSKQVVPIEAACPAGKVLLGGGIQGDERLLVLASAPALDGRRWQALLGHTSAPAGPPLGGTNDLGPKGPLDRPSSLPSPLPLPAHVQVFAICATDRLAASRRVIEGSRFVIAPNHSSFQSVACGSARGLAVGIAADGPGARLPRFVYKARQSTSAEAVRLKIAEPKTETDVWEAVVSAAGGTSNVALRVICAEP